MPLTPEETAELAAIEESLPTGAQNIAPPTPTIAPTSNLTVAEQLELEDITRDQKNSAVAAGKQILGDAIAPITTPIVNTANQASEGFNRLLRGLSGGEGTELGIEAIVDSLAPDATPADFFEELKNRTASRGGDILFGLMQNVFAPITGPASAIGEGAEKFGEAFSRDIGQRLPVEVQAGINALFGDPETFGTAAELTSNFLLPTKAVTSIANKVLGFGKPIGADPTAFQGPAVQRMTKTLEGLKTNPELPPTLDDVANLADDIPPPVTRELAKVEPGFRRALDTEVIGQITEGATQALRGNLDDSQRLFKNVAQSLKVGEIQAADLPDILRKWNLTPAEFAGEFSATVSKAGRDLQKLSALRKELGSMFKGDKQVEEILNIIDDLAAQMPVNPLLSMVQRGENFRRAALVSQPMTAVRNAVSQTGRMAIGQIDEALQAQIRRATVPAGAEYENVRQSINMFGALLNRLQPAKRTRFLELLESNNAALARGRLMSQPVQEITLGSKVSNGLNVFNRAQEFFFRRAGMEAKLRQLVSRAGKNYESIHPEAIPPKMYEEAARYGLEMAFASSPKSTLGKEMIRTLSKFPFTVVMPFPRFTFGNAVPFIMEHSPLGFLHAMSPRTLKLLASGRTDVFAKQASRAILGTIMWDIGLRIRQSNLAGEKWNEIIVAEEKGGGSKNIDVRSYAPLTIPMFIGELIANPSNIKPKDISEVTIGLNRIQGTGLELVDIIRQQKLTDAGGFAEKFLGAYLSSFATPLRTAKDIASLADPNEGVKRATREDPLVDPFLNAIPGFAKKLPELKSPTTTRRQETVGIAGVPPGLTRQLLGLNVTRKSRIQRELDRVQFPPSRMFAKTGIPEADNTMAGLMAIAIEKENLMDTPTYQLAKQKPELQRMLWAQTFERARSVASRIIAIRDPGLFLRIKAKGLNSDVRALIESETGLDLTAPDAVQQLQNFVNQQANPTSQQPASSPGQPPGAFPAVR